MLRGRNLPDSFIVLAFNIYFANLNNNNKRNFLFMLR